ncbi:MAG: energy-coupling factor transporter transmembrane protein EcfT [Synergistaceae bacterium]|jgi:energy-coupling factor transporter transmembrane protein EcfT|nr:energy-coupling factor transporter transmembrane protein EcfT [Synergistaceae bacterium]
MMIKDVIAAADHHNKPSKLDVWDPGCRVAASLLTALVISQLRSPLGLLAGSPFPLLLMFMDGREGAYSSMKVLARVNKVSLMACFLLPLTYPGERVFYFFSAQGIYMAAAVTWKLNLISIVIIRLATLRGMKEINETFGRLRVPVKMRVLLLLTARYILMLSDRMIVMLRAVRQRSLNPGFPLYLRAMACMTGTTLIHSMDRAEISVKAIQCRGGMKGFSSGETGRLTWFDSVSLAALVLYLVSVLAIEFLGI